MFYCVCHVLAAVFFNICHSVNAELIVQDSADCDTNQHEKGVFPARQNS